MSDDREPRQAVVLSGGGANGAYEVGVLLALCEGASPATDHVPLSAEIYTGTSVGAYNAAFMAQDSGQELVAARTLDDVWRQRIANTPTSCGNGIYCVRADPFRWIDPGCLQQPVKLLLQAAGDAAFFFGYGLTRSAAFLTSDEPLPLRAIGTIDVSALFVITPLDALLRETIDLARLARSPKGLAVAATDWVTGRLRSFTKGEIVDRFGTDAIKASAAVPGIFPLVPLDGTLFVDGGLKANTLLKPAIDAGAEVLHLVYIDLLLVDVPFPDLPNTLDALSRIYVILVAQNMSSDVARAEVVNEDLALAERLGLVRDDQPVAGGRSPSRRLRRVVEHAKNREPYRPITIHRYRPKSALGGLETLLNFDIARVDALIAQGYQDAVGHDCDESQCVIPDQTPT